MMVWFGNGGSKRPACPASVPIVSTPTPSTSRSWASSREAAASNPGLCGPSARALMNASRVRRVLHPVRSSTHAPAGIAAVRALPRLDASTVEQEIRVGGRLGR